METRRFVVRLRADATDSLPEWEGEVEVEAHDIREAADAGAYRASKAHGMRDYVVLAVNPAADVG